MLKFIQFIAYQYTSSKAITTDYHGDGYKTNFYWSGNDIRFPIHFVKYF